MKHVCRCEQHHTNRLTSASQLLRMPLGRYLGWTLGGLFIGGAGLLAYSMVEARRYRLEKERIITPHGAAPVQVTKGGQGNGGGSVAGLTARRLNILHISDLHLQAPEKGKVEFLERITDADYDLVLLTGDVFEDFSGMKYAHSLLKRKPRIGAFAVLGNHDYYQYNLYHKIVGKFTPRFRTMRKKRDVTPMVEALEAVGYTVLRNQSHSLPEHNMHIVGVDWPGIEEAHLKELVGQGKPHQFQLCLMHLPKDLDFFDRAGVHLAVGGHTHGGQVRLPGFGAIITDSDLARHEASGITYRGSTVFHISRGLSADRRSNFRFFCPPAATVLDVFHYASNTVPSR